MFELRVFGDLSPRGAAPLKKTVARLQGDTVTRCGYSALQHGEHLFLAKETSCATPTIARFAMWAHNSLVARLRLTHSAHRNSRGDSDMVKDIGSNFTFLSRVLI
jgi:hypothetical protein